MTSIDDLPVDILLAIIPYLSPAELLALCSTCRNFRNGDEVLYSPTYWSTLAHQTFRVPNQPAAAHDGKRWMNLYRRMSTQSRVFLWGHDDAGALRGSATAPRQRAPRIPGRFRPHPRRANLPSSQFRWPTAAAFHSADGLGDESGDLAGDWRHVHHVVSDLQSGGWLTVLLTANGELFAQGTFHGLRMPLNRHTVLEKLEFPPGFRSEALAPQNTIRQMSVGREHVLGLSDSGRIWSWYEKTKPAMGIRFATIDLVEGCNPSGANPGSVKKVVAGWCKSSAYIYGKGIVTWDPADSQEAGTENEGIDTILELNQWTVPNSEKLNSNEQVSNWIVLEHFIVYTTTGGKAFGCRFSTDDNPAPQPFELTVFPGEVSTAPYDHIVDCQGSFRKFALLYRSGAVLTSDQDYLEALANAYTMRSEDETPNCRLVPKLKAIPALQNSSVVQIAFADWHFHALHATGRISSYGFEPSGCGALGFGSDQIRTFRGTTHVAYITLDNEPLSQTQTTGRSIAFSDAIGDWLNHVFVGRDEEESKRRLELTESDDQLEELARASEWLEEQIQEVQRAEPQDSATDDDGLPAYFALSVTAAGWHSGSLVLVNEKKADAVAEAAKSKKKQGFPRLKKADGTPMPGTVDVSQWQCPAWQPVQEVEI